jgi:hypothetical protein
MIQFYKNLLILAIFAGLAMQRVHSTKEPLCIATIPGFHPKA